MRHDGPSELLLGVLVDPMAEGAFARGSPPEHAHGHLGPLGHQFGRGVVFFTPNGVDLARERATAWHYARSGWKKGVFPLPGAVYNRLARRSFERRPAVRRFLARLGGSRALFNPHFLQKQEALEALVRSDPPVPTPRFTLVRTPADVFRALEFWGNIYLKPVDGSLGRGIVRISRASGSQAGRLFSVTANRGLREDPTAIALDRVGLGRFLAARLRSERYVAQEGVPLPTKAGRPFDVRVLVQRPAGEWRLTGAAGRLGLPDHPTTHTLRGGERMSLADVEELTGVGAHTVEKVVCAAAKAVDRAFGGGFFEFSADIAVTEGGLAHVLEVNAKPFPFDEEEIRTRAARSVLAFAARVRHSSARSPIG